MSADTPATPVTARDEGPLLRCVLPLPDCSQERALEAFTSPKLLARWWANAELTAELVPGGRYDVWFSGIPARMTGQVIRYEPDSLLEFSWAWENEPGRPRSSVAVRVTAAPDRTTLLTVEHGPHGDDAAGLAAREQHRAGWEHFLPRLASALAG